MYNMTGDPNPYNLISRTNSNKRLYLISQLNVAGSTSSQHSTGGGGGGGGGGERRRRRRRRREVQHR